MPARRACLILLVVLACAWAQAPSATLTVGGDVKTPLTLTARDLADMPRATAQLKGEKATVEYTGVPVHEILKRAGLPAGKDLHGTALASYLLVEAKDGYQVVFALPEVDPAFTDKVVLLADAADGKPLGEGQGPFRLVVPGDKRGARGARMVTRFQLVLLRR
ncbi:molybdopterin-dependent oxidoreductase [Paludibaculum fermentans]|uniref:Molybdopterin-dependent oxidoreductase n=1 Tax=Paludibaculum fermentans TaxID=1473598 RepID=A0A7S7NWZ6_PALFE|nr:molybdopterin-dependent oxidoreductase [Paludibaculum fermentans]QOY91337.1 molybdopterin-dependent oxidoreductase [Paludibaculum fermentans]